MKPWSGRFWLARLVCLHALMDFNQALRAYDTTEGAVCQTVRPRIMSQKEAALEAVGQIGLNQIEEMNPAWFTGREREYEMLLRRMEILKVL